MKRLSLILPLLAAVLVAGCGGSSDSTSGGGGGDATKGSTKLSLVAYSTPQVVYDEIIPDFRKTAAGKGVGISGSYGPSGDQSRAVEAGQKADVVTFSTEPDMTRLVKDGIVAKDWNAGPTKGLVGTSVVSFVVRKGNPKNIHTWDDLLKPGIEVVTPNPFSSGSAKWNLLAPYAYKSDGGKDSQAGIQVLTPNPFSSGAAKWNLLAAYGQAGGGAKGLAYVKELLTKHVKVQDKSGRDALQSFTSGEGDVLLSYENEALTAQKKGEKVDYVNPDHTIRINLDIAVTEKANAKAKSFLDYILSKPAQERFASWGYRPIDADVLKSNAAKFPDPKNLFTIESLGGWSKLNDELFDPDTGSIAKIEQDAGVSTSK